MADQNNLFDMMNPKQAFVFGIVEGILVLCTIGFFILLLGGSGMGEKTTRIANTENNAVPTAQQPTAAQPTPGEDVPGISNSDHVRGNPDAEIVIVEYSDLECPFCARFHGTMNQVIDAYGDDVAWVYRHFPLSSHANARLAANAVECAAEQGDDFWEYTDMLFERQLSGVYANLSRTNLLAAAEELGFNTGTLETCMDSGKYNTMINQQYADAQAAGLRGTPFSVLIGPNGEQVPINGARDFAGMEATIQQLLN